MILRNGLIIAIILSFIVGINVINTEDSKELDVFKDCKFTKEGYLKYINCFNKTTGLDEKILYTNYNVSYNTEEEITSFCKAYSWEDGFLDNEGKVICFER